MMGHRGIHSAASENDVGGSAAREFAHDVEMSDDHTTNGGPFGKMLRLRDAMNRLFEESFV
jgi:hypothetical protein